MYKPPLPGEKLSLQLALVVATRHTETCCIKNTVNMTRMNLIDIASKNAFNFPNVLSCPSILDGIYRTCKYCFLNWCCKRHWIQNSCTFPKPWLIIIDSSCSPSNFSCTATFFSFKWIWLETWGYQILVPNYEWILNAM